MERHAWKEHFETEGDYANWLKSQYGQGNGTNTISNMIGIPKSTVLTHLHRYGIQIRDRSKQYTTCTCRWCTENFPVELRRVKERGASFCSQRCFVSWMRTQTGPLAGGWKGGLTQCVCEICEKEFAVRPAVVDRGGGRFCSNKCRGKWLTQEGLVRGENSPTWKGGLSHKPYPPEFNGTLKKKIQLRDNDLCARCGHFGTDVHHIDYDKENNDPNNLVLLCKSCHGQTNANREMWASIFQWHIGNLTHGWILNNNPLCDCILQHTGDDHG